MKNISPETCLDSGGIDEVSSLGFFLLLSSIPSMSEIWDEKHLKTSDNTSRLVRILKWGPNVLK